MDPQKTFVSGAVPILIYLDIGFIALGISVTHKQLRHEFIYFFTDFRHKRVYPVDDGLPAQGDALHTVIRRLSVKRQAQYKLPVKNVRHDGAGYGAFIKQRIPVGMFR